MVLFSGVLATSHPTKAVCGMILPNNDVETRSTTTLFLLCPSNHSFSAHKEWERPEQSKVLVRQGEHGKLHERVVYGKLGEQASLSLNENEETAALSWAWGDAEGYQEMKVELVEYIAFG